MNNGYAVMDVKTGIILAVPGSRKIMSQRNSIVEDFLNVMSREIYLTTRTEFVKVLHNY